MSLDKAREHFANFEPPYFDWPKSRIIITRRSDGLTVAVEAWGEGERSSYRIQVRGTSAWAGDETWPTEDTALSGPIPDWRFLSDKELHEAACATYHTTDVNIYHEDARPSDTAWG